MAGHTGWLEKRKHKRVQSSLKVQFLPLDDKEVPALLKDAAARKDHLSVSPGKVKASSVDNISLNGLAMVSSKPLQAGKYLLVEMVLPGSQEPLRVMAMVVWVTDDKQEGPHKYRNGIQIVSIHKKDLADLEKFIEDDPKKSR